MKIPHALVISVLALPSPALAGKAPPLFDCDKCTLNVPLVEGPAVGDLVDTKDGTVLVPGAACLRELEFLSESQEWKMWARRKASSRGVPLVANELAQLVPVRTLKDLGRDEIVLDLLEPSHRSIPIGSATRGLDEACLVALSEALCEDGSLKKVRMVTDVFGAKGLRVRSESGFGEISGETRGNAPDLDVRQVDAEHVVIDASDLFVVGWRASKVTVSDAVMDDLRGRCPAE